jgi:predicted Zn-dependent protease
VFGHVLKRQPQYDPAYVYLASAYSSLGRAPEAGAARAELLRIDPQFTLRAAKRFFLSSDEHAQQRFLDNLRSASLPE